MSTKLALYLQPDMRGFSLWAVLSLLSHSFAALGSLSFCSDALT